MTSGTAPVPRLELVSPIPPMRTGPANYLDMIVRRLGGLPMVRSVTRIAVEPELLDPGATLPERLHGIEVIDYRSLATEVAVGSTRIYFLANNNYHAYVAMLLERQRLRAQGRTIVVLHDPATFMLHRYRIGNGAHRLTEDDLAAATAFQFGAAAPRLLASRLAGDMPDIFEFVTHCQRVAIEKAHEIWVHSLFAMAKLMIECNEAPHRYPRIRLCAHPRPERARPATQAGAAACPPIDPTKLRIGVFGWITAPKRVTSVIRGLALALDRLGSAAADDIELLLVGAIPVDSGYEPLAEARRFDVAHCTRHIDYAPADTFESLQQSCQLIFNLRYPSCGETSGTLASARGGGAELITTRYQAFNEAGTGGASITFAPPFEDWMIAARICEAFERLKCGRPAPPSAETLDGSLAPVEKLVLREAIEVAMRGSGGTEQERVST